MDGFSSILTQLRDMLSSLIERLPHIVAGVLVFVLFYFAAKLLGGTIHKLVKRYRPGSSAGVVIGRLGKWLLMFVGILIAAVIIFPTFTPAKLIQLLGISSVAIGFAFRDILQNFLAGILILINEPFKVGDQIVVGSFEGTVEEIETRATHLRTYDGRRVVIPNSALYTDSVIVNTAFEKRRLEYDVGIGFGDDISRAREVILKALAQQDDVLHDPAPEVLCYDLAESSVNLRVRWWISPPKRRDAVDSRSNVLEAIKGELVAAGIDLPFPTRQILFHDQTEETDGDRKRQREGWPAGSGEVPASRSIAQALQRRKRSQSGAEAAA